MSAPLIIALFVILLAVGCLAFLRIGMQKAAKDYEAKVGSAETRARGIIDDAVKTAEAKKREALLEAKEEALKQKNEFEKEQRERRRELSQQEQSRTKLPSTASRWSTSTDA